MLEPPERVRRSSTLLKYWDMVVQSSNYSQNAVHLIVELVDWLRIADQCKQDITDGDSVRTAYMGDDGVVRAMPQVAMLKMATGEIRALERQLADEQYHATGVADGSPLSEILSQLTESDTV